MTSGYRRLSILVGLTALAMLAGCREHEQGRPLLYSKGTYQGKPDTDLSADTLEELRLRAQHQSYN